MTDLLMLPTTDPSTGRALPEPSTARWQPLRLILLNLWRYADQQFWFHNGALTARGINESGKTKALELTLPLLLHANTDPAWLDPFGGRTKKMSWNLSGWRSDSAGNQTGYSCIEFGRVNPDGTHAYVTIGGGFKVTAGNTKVMSWWWTAEDRRVDRDLELAPEGEPLTAAGLDEALAADGTVWNTAAAYRAEVDRLLFGIGPDRYDALVHLLLQLRRPNLAEKIDVDSGALSQLLAESLSPVDRTVVARSAEQFARLEAHQETVTRLEATRSVFETFVAKYRPWVQRVVLDAALEYRLAFNRHKDQTTKETRLADRVDDLGHRIDELANQVDTHELTITTRAAERDAIDTSSIEELDNLRRNRELAEGREEQTRRDLDAATERLEQADEKTDRLARDLEVAQSEMADAARQIELGFLGIDTPEPTSKRDVEAFRSRVERAVQTRRLLLRQARSVLDELRDATARLEQAREDVTDAAGALDSGTARLDELDAKAATAIDTWTHAAEKWWRSLVDAVPATFTTPTPPSDIDAAADTIATGQHPPSLPTRPWASVLQEFTSSRTRLGDRLADLDAEITRLDGDIAELQHRPLLPPEARPGIPSERTGMPLWQAVDFAEQLDDQARAHLEAALEASGLLDAVIDDRGLHGLDTHIDVDDLPTVTAPLSALLVVEPGADPIVASILDRISTDGDGGVWVRTDGLWRNGATTGRWTKPAASHIGETARRRAREARIAALQLERQQLDERRTATDKALEDLRGASAAFDGLLEAFPEPVVPLGHVQAAAIQRQRVSDLGRTLDEANEKQRRSTQDWRAATDVAHDALVAVGIATGPDAGDRIEDQATTLIATQNHLAELRIAADRHFSLSDDLADQRNEQHKLNQDVKRAQQAERSASHEVATSTAAHTKAEASLGEDARAKAQQRDDLLEEIKQAQAHVKRTRKEKEDTIAARGAAEQELSNIREERSRLSAARDDQLEALGSILTTDFGVIAVGVAMEVPDPPTYDGTLRIAQELIQRIDAPVDRTALRADLQTAFSELIRTEAGARVHMHQPDGMCQVLVPTVDSGSVDVTTRARQIADESQATADLLDHETRRLIDGFLLDHVAEHLVDRVTAADRLVMAMNASLRERVRPGRQSLEFGWVPSKDLPEHDHKAVRLFQRDIAGGDDRATVAGFLERRIQDARTDDSGDLESRLQDALDYRSWFTFTISVVEPDGSKKRLTSSTQSSGSGGSRDRILALALFATVSAFYDSTRDRQSPRLFMLDEAFSKVSEDNIRDCLALARDLDLDWFFTSHTKWFTYAEVPGVAIYDIHRNHAVGTVTPVRFVWDGTQKRAEDPWRDAL